MTNLEKGEELKNKNEFAMRSCWECNGSHEYLKNYSGLYTCLNCGRWYMNGGYFDNDEHCNKEYKELPPKKISVLMLNIKNK